MLKHQFIRRSCYRIMFYLGIVDFSCVCLNSIAAGYFSIKGTLYCTDPMLTYVIGCFSVCVIALWATSCATCLLLAINRCLTAIYPKLSDRVFGGYNTLILLLLPTFYFLYFLLFTPPVIFSSMHYAMFFNPFIGISGFEMHVEEPKYASPLHTINNVADVVLLSCTYAIFCAIMAKAPSSMTTSPKQQTFVQAALICSFNAFASVIYVIMQFVPTPTVVIVMGQISWQGSHGAPVFIYLFLNKSIRKAVLKLLGIRKNVTCRIGVRTVTSAPLTTVHFVR
uniref:Serpentine Receptor, class T n=1 Tax=Panagrellus redivivus TaxID=6233 RepID=A0A7E4WCG8_PANRE